MQKSFNFRNAHEALPNIINFILKDGIREESRNGPVLVYPYPVSCLYRKPWERVIFWPERDANPYFHFFESLGFLAGVKDLSFYAQFAKNIANYSDDGKTLHGNYGVRWRDYFDFDQLKWVVQRFKKDLNDRRVVLTMWDPFTDCTMVDNNGKDVPCNTQIYFRVNYSEEELPEFCMMVNCRSNDILFGALGANVVHMSILQEYLADRIGIGMGWYIQNSFNYHMYTNFYEKMMQRDYGKKLQFAIETPSIKNPYEDNGITHEPIGAKDSSWDEDLSSFLESPSNMFKNSFFYKVVLPMHYSYKSYKEGHYNDAIENIKRCSATDWKKACQEWLERRKPT